MRHDVTNDEAKLIAERLLTIGKEYRNILAILKSGSVNLQTTVDEFRHRLQPDGLLEFEAFLSDNSQIRIEFSHVAANGSAKS